MSSSLTRVGLVGCGNVSSTYLGNAHLFAATLRVVACADVDAAAAERTAAAHGIVALEPDALLADPGIDIVLNLTVPGAHLSVARAAVSAGKHVYVEKPLGTSVEGARALLAEAEARGVRVGGAPDTFLGAAHQTARRLVSEGALGRIIGGSAAVLDRGMEDWHPNPAPFYAAGGGPLFDMGPYYITALVSLLGPAARVVARGRVGVGQRTVRVGPNAGTPIPVEVPTSVDAIVGFAQGAEIVLSASWDVWRHQRAHIELHGTEGSMILPDPNWFGGPVLLSRRGGPWRDVGDAGLPFGQANRRLGDGSDVADYRMLGLADMAAAIRDGRPHRADGTLALHVLEIMSAVAASGRDGREIRLEGASG